MSVIDKFIQEFIENQNMYGNKNNLEMQLKPIY